MHSRTTNVSAGGRTAQVTSKDVYATHEEAMPKTVTVLSSVIPKLPT